MGAKCCMPVRDDMPMIMRKKYKLPHELNARRSNRCSPSWSFRCDNRTHIEDIADSPGWGSHKHHGGLVSEFRSAGDMEIERLSDGSSLSDAFQTPEWQKFSNQLSIRGNSPTETTDLSVARNTSHEEREICEFSNTMIASEPKSSSVDQVDPPSSGVCSQPSDPTSSGKSYLLPVPRFFKDDSESRVPTLDSVSEDGRPSFVLSFSSNDLSAGEFQYGSSDGWSLRSFSEFVLSSDSSQRDSRNTQLSSSFFSCDLRTCGLCSKLLKERASWKDNEIGIAAVLVCGHVYHAECLETVTPEASKFDPSCPTCTHGESSTGKALIKPVLKSRNKISRRAVADIDVDGNFMPELQKSGSCIVKDPRFGASSSRKNSFGRTFLRKHFSMGSQSVKFPPPRESNKKKGFWARYR